jgi:hypothetical protein
VSRQRAFRQRKDQHVQDLEVQVATLTCKLDELQAEKEAFEFLVAAPSIHKGIAQQGVVQAILDSGDAPSAHCCKVASSESIRDIARLVPKRARGGCSFCSNERRLSREQLNILDLFVSMFVSREVVK